MRKAVAGVLFWTYPRGSWQYDVLCVVIILFIVLTPGWVFDSSAGNESAQSADESFLVNSPEEAPSGTGPTGEVREEEPDHPQLTRSGPS